MQLLAHLRKKLPFLRYSAVPSHNEKDEVAIQQEADGKGEETSPEPPVVHIVFKEDERSPFGGEGTEIPHDPRMLN